MIQPGAYRDWNWEPKGASCRITAGYCRLLLSVAWIAVASANGCGGLFGRGGSGGTEGPPNFVITKTHQGNFTQGQQGATYSVTVSNTGGDQRGGGGFVAEQPPTGLTLVAMAGSGWTCDITFMPPSCTRPDNLKHGASWPPIAVTVNVAANATSPQVNVASVGNVSASDSTIIVP